ncbi:Brefeldin A-inhibited guanine nucleotide-exchange protein [Schistosoma japonicum]|uniref:Brefeldin A-inhibited guanine nucleotide-exchange protein n=2 Tax=Schistosoma japonicum TaxID=6182 RepID=A0A4Z2DUQ1_SCHJA|nr:Brefeldin A-inhibited guanine nucleotide-exchange protein 1 [Schistosoma japonicum]KAH8867376.1 Brefeldin A-inhibited guanine nucleotide-exchange protein 1 [Schistosoma japonicum]TNN20187.1 Brefeldin A-inhibited guanine nucleotide-exchange protein [Schistosoma japonicum]
MLAISSNNLHKQEISLQNSNSLKRHKPNTYEITNSPTSETNNTIQTPQPQFSISAQAFNMFLVKSIEKIANERETRKSHNSAIKKACEEALILLKEQPQALSSNNLSSTKEPSTHLPPLKSDCGILLSDERLLRPFQLACTMKSPKIVSTAVDSLQKLIAYGHIPNTAVCSSGKVRIIEQVVTTICSCFQGVQTDDDIQLQILKALLTVITSTVVEIHEADILLVVRTCYNIFMASKNPINQATARATLTQIISVLFQRMEQNAFEAAVAMNARVSSISHQTTIDEINKVGSSPSENSTQMLLGNGSDLRKNENHANEKLLNGDAYIDPCDSPDGVDADIPTKENRDSESKVGKIVEDILNEIIEKVTLDDEDGSNSLLSSVCIQSSESLPDVRKSSIQSSRSSSLSISVNTNLNQEWTSGNVAPSIANTTITTTNNIHELDFKDQSSGLVMDCNSDVVTSAHVTQKDAFLVFRSLCRLAVKDFTGSDSSDPKSHAVRSKSLSLQLLLNLLQQPGPLFLTSDIFIAAIKQYLCVALFKNGTSSIVEIFELSVAIFIALLTYFKPHLKRQVEVFFKDVLLLILESSKSSYGHKLVVIDALKRICGDAQCLVDIYLNYDCDLNMANIFERLTTDLAKIAQGRYLATEHGNNASSSSGQQQQILRSNGLECLVLILRCMTEWSQELYINPESQSFSGSELMANNGSNISTIENSNVDANHSNMTVFGVKPYDDPEAFESRKAQKEIYESGIALFNQSQPLRCLRLLQENGLIGESVESVAQFLLIEDRLSKLRVGDFLGENEPYNLRVMYAYVDQFDFTDKNFVPALREFLSGFRLPGEAQKIDRLMEKFAARYFACNPSNNLFASADTAYVLAFSIIMLTTDLHSSQIKPHNRMSKEDYIRMNRGINDSQDLPESYLAQIYDEIANAGIKLKADDNVVTKFSKVSTSTEISPKLDNRRQTDGEAVSGSSEFTCATHCEHVRPMFKLAWTPFLAAFSVGLQDSDALDVTHLCLEGIRYAIRIACIFHMELERDAYVQALARFTLLLTTSHVNPNTASGNSSGVISGSNHQTTSSRRLRSEKINPNTSSTLNTGYTNALGSNVINSALSTPEAMKQKNIDTIRTLITVAQTDGNYLGHAWLEILRCISQLESAHLITHSVSSTNGLTTINPHFVNRSTHFNSHITLNGQNSNEPSTITSLSSESGSLRSGNLVSPSSSVTYNHTMGLNSNEPVAPGSLAAAVVDSKKAAVLQEVMGETGSQSVVVAVDKIFTGSVRLEGEAIVEFVKALCQVSQEELNLPQPRTFSLQKVVEISYYNMGRIRLQWSRIWEHIGSHFTTAGRSVDEDVAEFVIDSLRQLSLKLIEKGELPNFHFQKEFLRPFVNILEAEPIVSQKVQDMIVRCVYQLVHSQYVNIRSGWTNIFAVLHSVASSLDEGIVDMAFETCLFTVKDVFKQHLYVVVDAFQPLVKALAEFSCNPRFPDTAMESIRLIRVCAATVAEQESVFTGLQNSELPLGSNSTGSPNAGLKYVYLLPEDDQIWLRGWMPVLCELFRVINGCKLDVRTRGLTVFFDILKSHGDKFKPLWWRETFAIIFRVFQHFRNSSVVSSAYSNTTSVDSEGVNQHISSTKSSSSSVYPITWNNEQSTVNDGVYRQTLSNMERTEWMNTTCNHTLFSIVDIFTYFYDVLHNILLDDIYQQLRWCCLQEHEQLARSGTSCLETLILSTGKRFNDRIWESTVNLIVDLFKSTVPHQLLTWRPEQMPIEINDQSITSANGNQQQSFPGQVARAHLFADLLNKCVVQYELIQTVDHILFYSAHSRNEDIHYLHEARRLAAASYPAFEAALQVATSSTTAPTLFTPSSFLTKENSTGSRISVDIINHDSSINKTSTYKDDLHTSDSTENISVVENGTVNNQFTSETNSSNFTQLVGASPLPFDSRGMYPRLSPQQRLTLAKCLLDSHSFAKRFNSDDEQRNILFQAGFKVKAKPNLLKQETHSLLCALRILFRLAEETSDIRDQADDLLDHVILDAFHYYHGLIIDGHRHAWDPCLVLIITQLIQLSPSRFHKHAACLYPGLCDLVAMAGGISPQVAALMRIFLLRCGAFFIPTGSGGCASSCMKTYESS